MLWWRKKDKERIKRMGPPSEEKAGGRIAAGMASKYAGKEVYRTWAQALRQRGIDPHVRIAEFLMRDIQELAGLPAAAPTPFVQVPFSQPIGNPQNPEAPPEVTEADMKVADAFTSVEIASQMADQLKMLSAKFAETAASHATSMQDATTKFVEIVNQLANAPDFAAWNERVEQMQRTVTEANNNVTECIRIITEWSAHMRALVDEFKAAKDDIVKEVVGRLQEYIDEAIERIQPPPRPAPTTSTARRKPRPPTGDGRA